MPQTSTIAFFLVAGYVVYVTVRGELPAYLCVIGLGSNCQPCILAQQTKSGAPANSSGGTTSAPTNTANPPIVTTGIGNGGSGGGGGSNIGGSNTNTSICPPGFLWDPTTQTCITTGFGWGNPCPNGDCGSGGGGGGKTDPCIDDPELCGFGSSEGFSQSSAGGLG